MERQTLYTYYNNKFYYYKWSDKHYIHIIIIKFIIINGATNIIYIL